jgi:homoserine kinase
LEAEPSPVFSIEIAGEGAGEIPLDDRNLTAYTARKILGRIPDLKIKVHNGIPACGGFGASGAAIAAGLLLGNELSEKKVGIEDIYNIAVEIEGHPDNVSAALFGGLIVNARSVGGRYSHIKIPVERRLKLVAVLPDSRVETEAARKILPSSVSLVDAVSNVQHSSLLVAALGSGDYEMVRYAVRDELHEKHRKTLIPHFDEFAATAAENGALAFTVSGAGSGCIAFCLDESSGVHKAFTGLIDKLGLAWRTEILEPVNKGAEVLTD